MSHGHRMPDYPIYNDPAANRQGREDFHGSDWKKLSKGMPLGKSINVLWDQTDPNDPPRTAPINMLQLSGPDDAALNMCVTLAPPKIALDPKGGLFAGVDLSNFPGPFYDNDDILGSAAFNGVRFVQPVATIEWGTLGAQHRAEIDFDNGAAINISGSFVKVFSRLVANETNSSVALYQLAACVSQGWGKTWGAKRSFNFLITGGAGAQFSSVFAIPRFARKLNLSAIDAGNVNSGNLIAATVRFWNSQGIGVQFAISSTLFAGNQHDSIDVPSGAYYFDVMTDGATAWNCCAAFDLAI